MPWLGLNPHPSDYQASAVTTEAPKTTDLLEKTNALLLHDTFCLYKDNEKIRKLNSVYSVRKFRECS